MNNRGTNIQRASRQTESLELLGAEKIIVIKYEHVPLPKFITSEPASGSNAWYRAPIQTAPRTTLETRTIKETLETSLYLTLKILGIKTLHYLPEDIFKLFTPGVNEVPDSEGFFVYQRRGKNFMKRADETKFVKDILQREDVCKYLSRLVEIAELKKETTLEELRPRWAKTNYGCIIPNGHAFNRSDLKTYISLRNQPRANIITIELIGRAEERSKPKLNLTLAKLYYERAV